MKKEETRVRMEGAGFEDLLGAGTSAGGSVESSRFPRMTTSEPEPCFTN